MLLFNILRFPISLLIVYAFDFLLGWPLAWFIEWYMELGVFWSIVVGFFSSALFMYAVILTGGVNRYAVAFSSLPKITATLTIIYMVLTTILGIIATVQVFNFSHTKSAIVGLLIIGYTLGRGIFGSIAPLSGIWDEDYNPPLRYKKSTKKFEANIIDQNI